MQNEDILVVMQKDLERALAKSEKNRRWAMLIDLRKCVGCYACTVGCVSENKLPPGIYYRPVFDYEQGKYPKVSRTFLPRPCMQCDKPPCVAACPVKGKDGATWKETTGVSAGMCTSITSSASVAGPAFRPVPTTPELWMREVFMARARRPFRNTRPWRATSTANNGRVPARTCRSVMPVNAISASIA